MTQENNAQLGDKAEDLAIYAGLTPEDISAHDWQDEEDEHGGTMLEDETKLNFPAENLEPNHESMKT